MKGQPNRLDVAPGHTFAGSAIDRARPLQFRLNGHLVDGFAGDTVLSAALASGFDAVGTHSGHPLALRESFAPQVTDAQGMPPLPMARMPAADGLDLRTVVPGRSGRTVAAWLHRTLRGPARSLGIGLDGAILPSSLQTGAADDVRAVDVVVIGGGVAGMTAAVTAAREGWRVALVERRPMLGGNALLFGRTEGEEPPEDAVARLRSEIAAHADIAVHLMSEAIGIDGRLVRVHAVAERNGAPLAGHIALEAPRIVLATGTVERLPLFAGNRLPGVAGAAEAFHMAHAYGVWPGNSAVVATVSNPAYRLAMLAADAGIAVRRIVDGRPRPQSRFREFCKAYGITMAGGVIPVAAAPLAGGVTGIAIDTLVSFDGYERAEEPLIAQRLVTCGGWQPDLSLWHLGGGKSRWQPEHSRLIAGEGPAHIALAGAAAGWFSTNACLDSGEAAIDRLFERPSRAVAETTIDPIYETPDDPAPIARPPHKPAAPCYLDAGASLMARPQPSTRGIATRIGLHRTGRSWRLAEQPRALSLCDVAAGVELGSIPPESAGDVARERTVGAHALAAAQAPTQEAPDPRIALVPDYLNVRFGPHARVWLVESLEQRRLDTGSLIFVNSDQSNPIYAMGVVLAPLDGERGHALALIGKIAATPGEGATLRDQSRPVPIRLVRRHEEGAETGVREEV